MSAKGSSNVGGEVPNIKDHFESYRYYNTRDKGSDRFQKLKERRGSSDEVEMIERGSIALAPSSPQLARPRLKVSVAGERDSSTSAHSTPSNAPGCPVPLRLTFQVFRDGVGVFGIFMILLVMAWKLFYEEAQIAAGEVVYLSSEYDAVAHAYAGTALFCSIPASIYVAVFRMPFRGTDFARHPVARIFWFCALPVLLSMVLTYWQHTFVRTNFASIPDTVVYALFLLGVPLGIIGTFFAARTIALRTSETMPNLKSSMFTSCFALILFMVISAGGAMFHLPSPLPWIASQSDTYVTIIASAFPIVVGAPFELLGRRFGEIVGNATGRMFQSVVPVTFLISLLMNLCTRFIVSSMDSLGALVVAVTIQAIIEIFNRGTLLMQIRAMKRIRCVPLKKTQEYLKSPQGKSFIASIIIARAIAEYVAVIMAMLIQFLYIGSEMNGSRLLRHFGHAAGVPLDTFFTITSTSIMLAAELIVDMISFRTETSLHGLPLSKVQIERCASFYIELGIIAFGVFMVFTTAFLQNEATFDCLAAANMTPTVYNSVNINLCNTCNASDISNTSDLHYWCFDME